MSLNTVGMVSINRTHEILSGVFGVPISTGTITSMVSECAKSVAESVQEIKETIIVEPLVHSDETGVRVDKGTVWAHVASTDKLTYIDVQKSRGKEGINAIGILLVFMGTLIHDCWASYFSYDAIRHGLCNARLLRELAAVVENTQQEWAQELINLLLQMKQTKDRFISQNRLQATPYYLKKYNLAFDAILAEAMAQNPAPIRDTTKKGRIKRGKTGALVDRLILHKDKYFLFFSDFSVPFDNNQAERDIRMFKVKIKVSGCFRTMDGARGFAAISSYVGTALKHAVSGFDAIRNSLLGLPFSIKSVLRLNSYKTMMFTTAKAFVSMFCCAFSKNDMLNCCKPAGSNLNPCSQNRLVMMKCAAWLIGLKNTKTTICSSFAIMMHYLPTTKPKGMCGIVRRSRRYLAVFVVGRAF